MSARTAFAALAAAAAVGAAFFLLKRGRKQRYRVSQLSIYPIKGARGIEVSRARTCATGLEFDRNWIVVFADSGLFCTARDISRLVLVETALEYDSPAGTSGHLVVRCPGESPVKVRFPRSFDVAQVVDVWGKPTLGVDEGDEVAACLSNFLGKQVRLLAKDPRHVRFTAGAYTPSKDLFDHEPQSAFADGFPYLVVSDASLDDLNARLAAKVPGSAPLEMARFRPNIVVSSGEDQIVPYAEDLWKRFRISGMDFYGAKKCGRCTVPSVDVVTGEQGTEPTKLLQSYRRVDKGNRFEACFGMNSICATTGGWIAVGDEVEITEEAEIRMVSKEENMRIEGGPRPVPVAAVTLVAK